MEMSSLVFAYDACEEESAMGENSRTQIIVTFDSYYLNFTN